jgi:hypothetical protein
MKKLFYVGLLGLAVFEILKLYFIMPMPGSQRMNSLDFAYFLHGWRWAFRVAFVAAALAGAREALAAGWNRRWLPILLVLVTGGIVWMFNFPMMADTMFKQPRSLVLKPRAESTVDEASVVVAVEHGGEAKAYPVRYLVYHHQVRDTVGGKAVMVTYCSVCRTGRAFEPTVDGQPEQFRLVGMDHFNAMFEDATTGSWWRQANGEAVAGPLEGMTLPEVPTVQMTLEQWFDLYPAGVVMQPDAAFVEDYDTTGRFERGESEGSLTRTDPASWQDKSWVVGVLAGDASKAYDWNELKEKRVINDTLGGTPIVLVLAADGASFAAYQRPAGTVEFTFQDGVLTAAGRSYDFAGREVGGSGRLTPVKAYQEFWHSWRTFHPDTLQAR